MNKNEFFNRHKKILRPAWEITCMIVLGLFYARFAYIFSQNFLHTYSLSALLYMLFELMIVGLIVIRNWPKNVSLSFYDWFISIGGTAMPLLMIPAQADHTSSILVALQLTGLCISTVGIASLYKSYGTVPANRGIRTKGLYKYIRHPLYAGYFLTIFCFVAQNLSGQNVLVLCVFCLFQMLRIFAEEEFLSQDQEYREYKAATPWRIIPYVW